MTYRASLGTRGELRRIAAEAENVTIDRVRPWIRKVQHCRLAPHVIVPQWTRLEHPVKPKPPPPLVSEARIVASEFVEEVLESATAKKFRRGRGRRGRPRKRADSGITADLGPAAEAGDAVCRVIDAGGASTAEVTETSRGSGREGQEEKESPSNQISEKKKPREGEPLENGEKENNLERNGIRNAVGKAEPGLQQASIADKATARGGVQGETDVNAPKSNEPIAEQAAENTRCSVAGGETVHDVKPDEDVEMTEAIPVNMKVSS